MTITSLLLIVGALVLLGVFIWYLIFRTEGVYLGSRVVIWLYDVYARRYDGIKNFDREWEGIFLAQPICKTLVEVPEPLILDVATGTARLALTLLDQPDFHGHIIGLDYSRKMLSVAAEKLRGVEDRVELIHQNAMHLPFEDNTFDAVTCLEALEFTPHPDDVLAEIVRVASPGALILITNRKGIDARLMPGKTQSRTALINKLREKFGLIDVSAQIWQVDYEQIWAFKPGILKPARDHALYSLLRCPRCGKRDLSKDYQCAACRTKISLDKDRVLEYVKTIIG